jgi:uncharacterized RDD family membrane protein YckC
VQLEQRITLTTPEGVDIDMVVAGLGSRTLAGLLDLAIQLGALIALSLMVSAANVDNGFAVAILIIVFFMVLFGYFLAFELLNRGRTVGKMAVGLRVVRIDGGPVTFVPSAVRNLLRLIDGWALLTLFICPVGMVACVASSRSQRLGDLAASTIVVRERFAFQPGLAAAVSPVPEQAINWDTSGVSAADVAAIRHYLARRHFLPRHVAAYLAAGLSARIQPKVAGSEPTWPPDVILETVAAIKAGRGA